jgi:hypothetical protein
MMTKDQIDQVDRVIISVCGGLIIAGAMWLLLAAVILMK